MMKAAVVHGKSDIRIEAVPRPVAGPGEIVVQVKASGICATDIKTLLGQGLPKELPAILGHEVAGMVEQVGHGVKSVSLGDRVAVYPIAVCGECYYCSRGRHNLCEKEFGLGHGIDGGFAELVRIPQQILNIGGVIKLPGELDFGLAALAEPLSCCLAAARSNRVGKGDTVLVIGAGPMGLFHLKVCRHLGARVIMVDLRGDRLQMASQMGAEQCINTAETDLVETIRELTGGRGADVVVASLGVPQVVEQYLPTVRKGGIFNIFGGPPAGRPIMVDPRWIHYSEVILTGTFAATPDDFRQALQLIAGGQIKVEDMISHRFTLDNMLEAIELAKKQEIIKGIVEF